LRIGYSYEPNVWIFSILSNWILLSWELKVQSLLYLTPFEHLNILKFDAKSRFTAGASEQNLKPLIPVYFCMKTQKAESKKRILPFGFYAVAG
jgi:hypothetical protein